MCLRITVHMELLTEFAGPAFRYYKHGTPDGVLKLVLQISGLHQLKLVVFAVRYTKALSPVIALPMIRFCI
jgi:hypothetical protein